MGSDGAPGSRRGCHRLEMSPPAGQQCLTGAPHLPWEAAFAPSLTENHLNLTSSSGTRQETSLRSWEQEPCSVLHTRPDGC